ncbi:MAG: SMC-Scp complex subunit ScpB [Terriglobales bacterium]
MSIKAKIEAIIYAAEEPITFEQIFALVKDDARQQLLREQAAEDSALIDRDARTWAEEEAQPYSAYPSDADSVRSAELLDTPAEPVSQHRANGPGPVADAEVKSAVREAIAELIGEYSSPEHGIEIRQIAGGYRMATKPEQHDVVRAFAKGLKPPIRLSLPALETLAVIAYKQPITAPEISDIRGVDCSGVLGTLLDRKLITTAGRKQVIGRPILYKTTKEFLLRFGLKDVSELPSMEEFEKLAAESLGADLFAAPSTPPETSPATQSRESEEAGQEAAAELQSAEPGNEAHEAREGDVPAERES